MGEKKKSHSENCQENKPKTEPANSIETLLEPSPFNNAVPPPPTADSLTSLEAILENVNASQGE